MFSYDPTAGSNAAHNIHFNGVPLNHMTIEELRQMGVTVFNELVGEMPADFYSPTLETVRRLVDGVPVWQPGDAP